MSFPQLNITYKSFFLLFLLVPSVCHLNNSFIKDEKKCLRKVSKMFQTKHRPYFKCHPPCLSSDANSGSFFRNYFQHKSIIGLASDDQWDVFHNVTFLVCVASRGRTFFLLLFSLTGKKCNLKQQMNAAMEGRIFVLSVNKL